MRGFRSCRDVMEWKGHWLHVVTLSWPKENVLRNLRIAKQYPEYIVIYYEMPKILWHRLKLQKIYWAPRRLITTRSDLIKCCDQFMTLKMLNDKSTDLLMTATLFRFRALPVKTVSARIWNFSMSQYAHNLRLICASSCLTEHDLFVSRYVHFISFSNLSDTLSQWVNVL